jgi:hypothetical protein
MSDQLRSRALCEGRVKALRRMKQPMTLVLEASPTVRDPVARALGQRDMRGAGEAPRRPRGAAGAAASKGMG